MSVISVRPVTLPAPGRGDDLQVRVTAPATGNDLPVIVFSHGFGQSMDGYAPLVDFWSQHGFAVVQPTHLDSRTLNVTPADPRYPDIWRHRVDDLVAVLDHLDLIEEAVPGAAGRLDHDRIAVAGHSWGAQSAGMLLGARVEGSDEDRTDPRVKAGVLLAMTGTGGAKLTPFAAEHFPFMNPDFAHLTTPSLLVAGDKDQSMLSPVGPEWFTEAYALSPGIRALLTVHGGEHSLGGINGYLSTETTDESPERVALIQRVTTAFLRGETLEVDPAGHLDVK
ncbi:alpha/beta hydrolase family protein [Actinoplanes sp. NPDC020271]|uniref:alpha/beta hydrolase family protein n=1 Tax=Actinoplanes sp. NPDC020271 TaxID=3363896 RepID=UPI0037B3BFC0